MLNRLWGWIAAAFAVMGAALIYIGGQRDRAREARDVAKGKARSQSEARRVERNIDEARAKARQNTADTINEHQARPDDERPSGSFRTK